MRKIRRNLIGKKFGKLSPIEYKGVDKFRNAVWLCQCDCGNTLEVKGTLLTNGKVVSCGKCDNKYNFENPKKTEIDISVIGKKFGRLLVLDEWTEKINEQSGKNLYMCKCKCDCGNIVEIPKNRLLSGGTKSCGCLHREKLSNNLFNLKIDNIGKKFHKLTVLDYDIDKKMWKCRCDCGNITYVKRFNDNTKSCGCLKKERKNKEEKNIE